MTASGTFWKETYPEVVLYHEWIKKMCKDPHHAPIEEEQDDGTMKKRTFFAYDTPRGMHRSRCGFCEASNGAALQAFSAEGALDGLYNYQKATWLAGYKGELKDIAMFLATVDPNNLLENSFAINFLHDEIIWETPGDEFVDKERVLVTENIMINAMQQLTPDVKAGTESAAMRRWYKKAEPIRDDNDNLVPWVPEEKKKV